jgi:hypothetical protein
VEPEFIDEYLKVVQAWRLTVHTIVDEGSSKINPEVLVRVDRRCAFQASRIQRQSLDLDGSNLGSTCHSACRCKRDVAGNTGFPEVHHG